MTTTFITTRREGRVGIITLTDPDRRNAINLAMNDELVACLDELEADADIGALVITGAGSAFCAGADLSALLDAEHNSAESLQRIYAGFLRLAASPLPVVAAVNGPAVGAGMNIALACDLILAGRSARFDPRFLQIGLHPGGGHTWRVERITDVQTVKAMVLFGQALTGEQAERVGLAWACVADEALVDEAIAMAARAARAPKELVARTKATIEQLATITSSAQAVELELVPQVWSIGTDQFRRLVTDLQASISK